MLSTSSSSPNLLTDTPNPLLWVRIFSTFYREMYVQIAVALLIPLLGCVYRALTPPAPNICGSTDGPPVTSPRVKLDDGRHIAYGETGVPKEEAKYKIIVVHGYRDSKDTILPAPQELVEELGIYFLYFDRAGYGESDPNPSRSVKSDTYDIEELADKLQLGSKFYVIGISLGACSVYSFFKYLPHRLSGAALVVPLVNHWWSNLPTDILNRAFKRLLLPDRWTFRIAHHAPWLFYWWMNQKWFTSSKILAGSTEYFGESDLEMLKKLSENPRTGEDKAIQQGSYESLHRDVMVGFGKWEFSPLDLANPFPNDEGSVDMWIGVEDKVVSVEVNRYIADKLRWINFHEVRNFGHLMIFDRNNCEAILRSLLVR